MIRRGVIICSMHGICIYLRQTKNGTYYTSGSMQWACLKQMTHEKRHGISGDTLVSIALIYVIYILIRDSFAYFLLQKLELLEL